MSAARGGLIRAVHADGIGAEIGLEPGDRLVSINGHVLRDLIDYRYYGADETLVLQVERAGRLHRLEVERDYDEELGLEFEELVFDGLRECDNRCPFCFVAQMPKGLRRSLYIRDDDYRYSFLTGSYITLTNLSPQDWQRITEQHLSPLYVSIHATDPQVRRAILGNPEAQDILGQLRCCGELGIRVHGQIVIWPGVNDGAVLRTSIEQLAELWPIVRTLAVVPVGLTRYHRGPVRLVTPDEASALLDLLGSFAERLAGQMGTTWLYPSDELYLLAGRPVPAAAFYADDAQRENGVGLVRTLLEDWGQVRRRRRRPASLAPATLVCGALIAPLMQEIAADLRQRLSWDVRVVPVVNRFFGASVTVSGLLTGEDVLAALQGSALGARVFLPQAMFSADGVTLDGLSVETLEERLATPVSPAAQISEIMELARI